MLIKFSPKGKVLMTIGRREDPVAMLSNMPGGGASSRPQREVPRSAARPMSPWDQQGNIFVSDGTRRARRQVRQERPSS
jgi:hypothetical protein